MKAALVASTVKVIRMRHEQGGHSPPSAKSVEWLEDTILALADQLAEAEAKINDLTLSIGAIPWYP